MGSAHSSGFETLRQLNIKELKPSKLRCLVNALRLAALYIRP